MPNPISSIQPSTAPSVVDAVAINAPTARSANSSSGDTFVRGSTPNPYASATGTVGVTRDLNASRLATARAAIISEFKNKFVSSAEFQSTFGPKTWSDVKADVTNGAASFGATADSEVFNDADGSTTFSGRIYGLYTEARINPQGQADKIYFEID